MVSRTESYYGTQLMGHQRVTQWDTISPTIFNMLFDAVIYHWVIMVAEEEAGPYGFRRVVQWMAEFFYADYGLVGLPSPARLQEALYILTGMFNRFVLHTKVEKRLE